jgi:drug/metabolite transporter (DMT)-like permease
LKLSGVGDATLLTDINPIFVAIFGNCYFGIKIEKQSWIGIGLCTVGIVLLAVLTHGIADNLMIPIGLTSAMFGALAYISLKEATKTHSPRLIIFSFLIVLSITGLMMMERIPTALSPELLLILGVIIVFNLLGQFLTTASFKYLDTHLASILTITACLWGYLIDILFFTKSISAALISPIGMLIGGTALVVFEKRSRIR